MRTVITGTLGGVPVDATWDDGDLTGNPTVLDMLRDVDAPIFAGGGFPEVQDPDLRQHLDFVVAAFALFDDPELEGDWPQQPSLPPGVVA